MVEAIDAISRRLTDKTYPEYIERVAQNPLALRVKLADLRDNLDPRRVSTALLSAETLEEYRTAQRRLIATQALASALTDN